MSNNQSIVKRAEMRTDEPGYTAPPGQMKPGICAGMPNSSAPTAPPPSDAGERPTSIPSYDVATFARQQTGMDVVVRHHASEAGMLAMLASGDAARAHDASEELLKQDPNDAVALRYEPLIRVELEARLIKTLGSLLRIPSLSLGGTALSRLPLDHRTGFVLSHVDGVSNYDTILAICGMPRIEALRALCELLRQGAITTR